jgi:hypothetical protein
MDLFEIILDRIIDVHMRKGQYHKYICLYLGSLGVLILDQSHIE